MTTAVAVHQVESLPDLVNRAAAALAGAKTSAEVLEARDLAGLAYDAAKRTARFARAKKAHDDVVSAVYRAQADALLIEARAKIRLADEYDAAQERGEVVGPHDGAKKRVPNENAIAPATAADLGLTRKQVHEARQIRDAEKLDPGISQRAIDAQLAERKEPTKAYLRQIVTEAATRALKGTFAPRPSNKNPHYKPDPQWDAMLTVSAGCRDMMDKVRGLDPEYIIGGFIDEGQRSRNLASILECRDYLNSVLQAADAE